MASLIPSAGNALVDNGPGDWESGGGKLKKLVEEGGQGLLRWLMPDGEAHVRLRVARLLNQAARRASATPAAPSIWVDPPTVEAALKAVDGVWDPNGTEDERWLNC